MSADYLKEFSELTNECLQTQQKFQETSYF